MKRVTYIFSFLFIGFCIWIVYLVWMTFFSNHINLTSNYNTRYWEQFVAFDNLENSLEQREFKEEFENLLTIYLLEENLYSEEELLVEMKKSNIGIINYSDFYRILNIYIGYLQKNTNKKNKEILYRVVDKNLENFYQLMKNSNDFFEYLYALNYLEMFFKSLECSSDFALLFEKHLFVEDEFFFKKLELDKEKYLNDLVNLYSEEQKKNIKYIKAMKTLTLYVQKILNEISRRTVIAIKDGSSEARKEHKEYIEKLKMQDSKFSEEWKKLWTLTINQELKKETETIIYIFSTAYESHIELLFYGYEKHKFVNKQHQQFLDMCNE